MIPSIKYSLLLTKKIADTEIRIRGEAEDIIRREPELATFIFSSVLHHDRLEQSVDRLQAIVLGERVKRSGELPSADGKRYIKTAATCLKSNMEEEIKGVLGSFDEVSRA